LPLYRPLKRDQVREPVDTFCTITVALDNGFLPRSTDNAGGGNELVRRVHLDSATGILLDDSESIEDRTMHLIA